MKRRSVPYQAGQRYLLQYPGGVECLAVVARVDAQGVPALESAPCQPPPGRSVLPGGEWLLERDERLVRDWRGAYWSVTAQAGSAGRRLAPDELPVACQVEFTRHSPEGERMSYRAGSLEWPEVLPDSVLAGLLRRAWEALDTDAGERRRRSAAATPATEL